jgi:hypothetical protein
LEASAEFSCADARGMTPNDLARNIASTRTAILGLDRMPRALPEGIIPTPEIARRLPCGGRYFHFGSMRQGGPDVIDMLRLTSKQQSEWASICWRNRLS